MQVWEVSEPYLDIHCLLGEGPFYEKDTHSLRFVDIQRHHLHTIDLASGPSSLKTLELDTPVSVTADIENIDPRDKILVGLKYGIAVLDRTTGQYEYLQKFSESTLHLAVSPQASTVDFERVRGNDGAADPHGRFWLGSMTDFDYGDFQPEGIYHHAPFSPSPSPALGANPSNCRVPRAPSRMSKITRKTSD